MDEVREAAVDVPPEVLGDARAALVVRPDDYLVIVMPGGLPAARLGEFAQELREKLSDDLRDRVLVVAGAEQLAVLRSEGPA